MVFDRRSTGKSKDTDYSNDRERISQAADSSTGYNDVSDMLESMFVDHRTEDEKKMQEQRAISFLSGFPIVGSIIRGSEQARQVEDLYNKTGKTAAYPGLNGGYGGIGAAAGGSVLAANRIANGFNDLYQFYTGEPDSFRNMQNFSYW